MLELFSQLLFFTGLAAAIMLIILFFERASLRKRFTAAQMHDRTTMIIQQQQEVAKWQKQTSPLYVIIGIFALAAGFIGVSYLLGRSWRDDAHVVFLVLLFIAYMYGKAFTSLRNLAWMEAHKNDTI